MRKDKEEKKMLKGGISFEHPELGKKKPRFGKVNYEENVFWKR